MSEIFFPDSWNQGFSAESKVVSDPVAKANSCPNAFGLVSGGGVVAGQGTPLGDRGAYLLGHADFFRPGEGLAALLPPGLSRQQLFDLSH